MGRITRNEEIIRKQESIAKRIQQRVDNDDVPVDVLLDAFEKVGKWIAIRNKVEDEGAGDIRSFKERINGAADKRYPPSRRPKGYVEPEPPKPRLDALKERLPHASNRSAVGNSDGAGEPVSSSDSSNGSVLSGV